MRLILYDVEKSQKKYLTRKEDLFGLRSHQIDDFVFCSPFSAKF